jgi:hypothetical protein
MENQETTDKQYDSIRGWLILVAIVVVVTPIRLLVVVGKSSVQFFSGNTWEVLTTPGAELYHPLLAPILIFELIGNAFLVCFSIILAVYFFQKRKIVPKMIIVFLLSSLIIVAVDYFAYNLIPTLANQNALKTESAKGLVKTLIYSLILGPYFLLSKRVKGTFIH